MNPEDMANFPCFNRVSLATVVFSLLSWSEARYSIPLSLNESCFCLGAGAGMLTQEVPCNAVRSFLGLNVIRCCTAQTKILFCIKSRSVEISTPLSDTSSLSDFWGKSLSACYFSFHKDSNYLSEGWNSLWGISEPYIVPSLYKMVQAPFAKHSLE